MSRFFIDTPFERWLIVEFCNKKICSIKFSSQREGIPLTGDLKKVFEYIFLHKDFSCFDYTLLDMDLLSRNELLLHKFLIETKIGEVYAYSDVATVLFKKPTYARFVGNLLKKNRFVFVVPCHRVVAKNGIGGYTPSIESIELKRKILRWEGLSI
ncbi:MGMT family protein [Hippea jasoniae]|uniref:MGMT family protein n=1 Tax=Hippea jasoniae TaxID=944479 RepID=UPI000A5C8D73|nr:methylated-DNA--[protein]-cysteine S-methyltransferase [Hippea jasoniae]